MTDIVYLSLEDVLGLVRALGVGPVRDIGLLESAVGRPASAPFGTEAYPRLALKAAALLESLVNNHPLVDGNKRLGWLATVVFLDLNGHEPDLDDDVAFALVWGVASRRGRPDVSSRPAPRRTDPVGSSASRLRSMTDVAADGRTPLSVSVVIPVYRGEDTLPALIDELAALHDTQQTPQGRPYRVSEVLLVWDRGPGRSDEVLRQLHDKHDWVRPIWLSRNFGQHAATLAGMTSSGGEWIVTMDEDGQQDPAFIGAMLDTAYATDAQLVYGQPTNPPPHGALRNAGSKLAKGIFVRFLADQKFEEFNSYRLVLGEVGRSVAAYTGTGRLPRRRAVLGGRRRHDLPGGRARRGPPRGQLQLRPAVLPLRPARRLVRHEAAVLRHVHRDRLRRPRRPRRPVDHLRAHRRRPAGQRLGVDVHRADGRGRCGDDVPGHHRPVHRGGHEHVAGQAAVRRGARSRDDVRRPGRPSLDHLGRRAGWAARQRRRAAVRRRPIDPGPVPWADPAAARQVLHDQARGLSGARPATRPGRSCGRPVRPRHRRPPRWRSAELEPLRGLVEGLRSARPLGAGRRVRHLVGRRRLRRIDRTRRSTMPRRQHR